MLQGLVAMDWGLVLIACLTLGLSPFMPPHLFEKLGMLRRGELKKGIDWFDLFFHATPFFVLFAKLLAHLIVGMGTDTPA